MASTRSVGKGRAQAELEYERMLFRPTSATVLWQLMIGFRLLAISKRISGEDRGARWHCGL